MYPGGGAILARELTTFVSGTLSRVLNSFRSFPGVSLADSLNPRLPSGNPPGCGHYGNARTGCPRSFPHLLEFHFVGSREKTRPSRLKNVASRVCWHRPTDSNRRASASRRLPRPQSDGNG